MNICPKVRVMATAEEAEEAYDALPAELRYPSYHPSYVLADARRRRDLEPRFFVHTAGGECFYLGFHLRYQRDFGVFDVLSPYGYGGAVSTSEDPAFLEEAWGRYREWAVQQGVLVEFMRFHPLLGNSRIYHGRTWFNRSTVWMDLNTEDLLMSFETRARTTVRKALREGVSFRFSDEAQDVEAFIQLYRENMARIGASEEYHFGRSYLEQMLRLDSCRLALCERAGKVEAAALFLFEGRNVEYHLSASSREGQRLGAVNLMLHEVACTAQAERYQRMHLGGGFDTSPENSLLFFKEGFSSLKADYHIGGYIHRQEHYQSIRDQWARQHGKVPSRVMFYEAT